MIPYVNFLLQNKPLKEEILEAVGKIIDKGNFILGDEVQKFEENFAKYCGVNYAVGVANGTDALILAMKALGIKRGEKIITAPNSFIATISSIVMAEAKPVFCDVKEDLNIDLDKLEKLLNKSNVVIPVHLTGNPVDIEKIKAIKNPPVIIEDAAQAVGTSIHGKKAGTLGDIGCFSLHPLKTLGAFGDGGAIITNEKSIYENLKILRNHGLEGRDTCKMPSINSRLDTIQATILNIKLNHIDSWIKKRREIANIYTKELDGVVQTPIETEGAYSTYHTYIIRSKNRDKLKQFLFDNGVDTRIHYPIPAHLQPSYEYLGYKKGSLPITEKLSQEILSLPIYPELTEGEISHIISTIKKF